MTGHEDILAMRREGRAPRYVWLSDYAVDKPHDLTVRIAPADIPEQLDLRFLKGLTAVVEGADDARVLRLAAAASVHAKRVIATTCPAYRVTRVTDTEGILQWPN